MREIAGVNAQIYCAPVLCTQPRLATLMPSPEAMGAQGDLSVAFPVALAAVELASIQNPAFLESKFRVRIGPHQFRCLPEDLISSGGALPTS